jgi:signal transduction histidine kinase
MNPMPQRTMMTNLSAIVSRFDAVRAVGARARTWVRRSLPRARAGGLLSQSSDTGVTWSIGRKIAMGLMLIIGSALAVMMVLYRSMDNVASARTVMLAYLLIPIFLIVSITAGWWIVRHISSSVEELRAGTEMVTQGNLRYRVLGQGRDELGLLARRFNKMVAQLEATTISKEELKKAHEALSKRTEELTRSNIELDQFASVVSHDLQEPLRMITAYVHLLQTQYRGKLDKDADEFIGFAVDGAERMQGLINDLLTYSRVGTRGKEFTSTDCNVVLTRTILNLKTAIDESGAQVTYDPLPTVPGDEFQLGQLLQNLISNAIKYRGERPIKIHVGCARDGDMWRFAVYDNGIGIDREHIERIFVIFQRLHTRQEYPGTGIGLAICKKIVDRHRGKIWVESEPMEGSTFYFSLPVQQDLGPANVES